MGAPEVARFLSHLASAGHVAVSTQNQALNALVFLYRPVLERPLGELGEGVRAKRPARLPTVLAQDEARAVLAEMDGVCRLVTGLLYGSGLRLLEALRLRVTDLEFGFQERQITVRDGKGRKDRVSVLPATLRDSSSGPPARGERTT